MPVPLGQRSLGDALAASEPLAGLLQRLAQSRARLSAVVPVLDRELADLVQAGPLDDTRWILLVPHSAAAAKLRHRLPDVEAALTAAGHPPRELKVKVARPR
ncbi:MAG: hypothetical protein LW768_08835 [Rubrivivax sp.]|jgi:hypothetical protein|nr:hypothetical protein [Rubrivivax sp.]